MSETKRFWVAAISKPCVDGTVSLELGWFNSRIDCDEFEIVDTIRGFVERVPGWKCGEVKQVKDVEGWPGAPVTLEDVLSRHRRALENPPMLTKSIGGRVFKNAGEGFHAVQVDDDND